jgi:hypothetical protein
MVGMSKTARQFGYALAAAVLITASAAHGADVPKFEVGGAPQN